MKTHPTLKIPRCRTFRNSAIVFSHHMQEMLAVFCAQGPDIRAKTTVDSFEDVDIYPLIAAILGLRIGPIDGGLSIVGRVIEPHS